MRRRRGYRRRVIRAVRLFGAQAYESIRREIEKFLPPPVAPGR